MQHMQKRGIVVSAVHQRNDVHSCVAQYITHLPKLNGLADEIVCLPVGWWVDAAARARVAAAVKEWATSYVPERPYKPMGKGDRPRCIITGGCGFIGHHVVEHFVKGGQYDIVVLDKLSYASKGYDRLRDTGVFHLIECHCVDLASRNFQHGGCCFSQCEPKQRLGVLLADPMSKLILLGF